MQFRELSVDGAWEITPKQLSDPRGVFMEAFKSSAFVEATNRKLDVKQVNCSVSAAGVVRGIHFAQVPPSQAKYVMCPRGAVLDYVVDIRVGSPTFGQWDSVLLDDADRRAIFISEGLGHMFVSLEDDSTVTYLCSEPYAPGREFGVNPRCRTIGIGFPSTARDGSGLELVLSEKDEAAPGLLAAQKEGILPSYQEQQKFITELRE
ncbi:MAG TPA: dTDP-4-keto-6-deoxy-D-glucose epimerase, partial [Actinomycetales bacterium]|nr:dTDP-4-keto-6-deoxy-D-glucose epimerase [Actinomycetales bacterium]